MKNVIEIQSLPGTLIKDFSGVETGQVVAVSHDLLVRIIAGQWDAQLEHIRAVARANGYDIWSKESWAPEPRLEIWFEEHV